MDMTHTEFKGVFPLRCRKNIFKFRIKFSILRKNTFKFRKKLSTFTGKKWTIFANKSVKFRLRSGLKCKILYDISRSFSCTKSAKTFQFVQFPSHMLYTDSPSIVTIFDCLYFFFKAQIIKWFLESR